MPAAPRARAALLTLLRLAWAAGPRDLLAVGAAELVYGLSMPVRIIVVQRLLRGLPSSNHESTIASAAVLGLAFALGGYAQLFQREKGRLLGETAARAALERVLDATQTATLVRFDDAQFHDRVRRAQQAQNNCSQAITALFAALAGAVATLGILLGLTSVSLLILPVAVLASLPVAVAARRNSEDEYFFVTQLVPAERQRLYIESLLLDREPAKEIRAFDLAPFLRSLHDKLLNERMDGLRRLGKQRMRRVLLSSSLASVGTGSIAAVLFSLYFSGRMSLTTVGVAVFGFAMLKGQLTSLSRSGANLYEALLFVAELDNLTSEPVTSPFTGMTSPAPRFQGMRMEDVSFTYPTGPQPAIQGVSLHIEPGELIALVGPNGSGKTTVAKLLAGLYAPERGRIFWGDLDRSGLDSTALRDRVVIGFQDFARFRMSVADNIAVGRHERRHLREEIIAAAGRAGMLGYATGLPNGFDTALGPELEGGGELSQGQWQRLALARVFFRNADMVILDEPTAALDALAEFELFEMMRRGLEGRSAVMISHRLATVRSADRIYVFDRGRIVETGSHTELLAFGGLYARMYDVQASAYTSPFDSARTTGTQVVDKPELTLEAK